MKKTVLFTAGVTFAAAILTAVIIYFIVAFVSPVAVAGLWNDVGAYSLSVKYYERQYEKTGDEGDLLTLCLKTDEYKDSKRASFYLEILTGKENFNALCESEDAKVSLAVSAYDYYYGKYAVAEYYRVGINAAISVAVRSQDNGYTRYNPYYVLLNDGKIGLTESDREVLIAAAEEYVSSFPIEEQDGIRQEMGL